MGPPYQRLRGRGPFRKEERLRRFPPGEIARKALEGLKAKSVLDIGTGTGVFAEAFAALGLFVVGLDPRADRLEVARAKVKGARFVEGRAEALPFPDGSFDLAFFGLALHHLDPVPALREASRVARRVAVLEWPYREGRRWGRPWGGGSPWRPWKASSGRLWEARPASWWRKATSSPFGTRDSAETPRLAQASLE